MIHFELLESKSLPEACSLLAEHQPGGQVLAGGQYLVNLLRNGSIRPKYLVDIKGLAGLSYIRADGDGLKIGALTTHRDVEQSPLVKQRLTVLWAAEQQLGCVQSRNWGTIGGNLCQASPATDIAPILMSLGALAKVVSSRGERTVPLDGFFTGYHQTLLKPDEIMVEIQVPAIPSRSGAAYHKETVKFADPPIVAVATSLSLDGAGRIARARIVLQAVGIMPIRAVKAESLLMGHQISDALVEEAAVLAAGEAQPRSTNWPADYKREMVRVTTVRVVKKAMALALKGGELN